jgi:protein-L-isoaspartate(D-aspartate) O-methyltransferase
MQRVTKQNAYLVVESYRNESEKANLLYWQLTCETFCTPKEWEWWFKQTGYKGDHSFIYFE